MTDSASPWLLELLHTLLWPLSRLLVAMVIGQLVANLLEALHWTRFVARLASPLVRLGHLQAVAGASFSLAFFSPAAANALLAESYEKKELSRRELMFANLFNSSPTYLVHLPTLFSLVYAFLGNAAFIYVGLTFLAATGRTALTIVFGRLLLPPLPNACVSCILDERPEKPWREVVATTLRRFKKRIGKLILFTIPTYCAIYAMQQAGWFTAAERIMADHAGVLSFLRPESLGIIVLHLAAESGAALSAAASLAHTGALSTPEIIMALLVGNIVSSPMRAFRHQFPAYAGYFTPSLAFHLVVMNQLCRVLSLVAVAWGYYLFMF